MYFRITIAFIALTLLVGRQEGHPICKKLSDEALVWCAFSALTGVCVLLWLSVWSEVQIVCVWSC